LATGTTTPYSDSFLFSITVNDDVIIEEFDPSVSHSFYFSAPTFSSIPLPGAAPGEWTVPSEGDSGYVTGAIASTVTSVNANFSWPTTPTDWIGWRSFALSSLNPATHSAEEIDAFNRDAALALLASGTFAFEYRVDQLLPDFLNYTADSFYYRGTATAVPAPRTVPEPSTLSLVGLVALAVGLRSRRRWSAAR
jgi:hypothetical protein